VNYLLVTVSSKIVNDSHFLETSNLIYFMFIGIPCLMIITYCWCGGFLKWGYPQIIHVYRIFHEIHHPAIGVSQHLYHVWIPHVYIYNHIYNHIYIIYIYHIYIYTKESIIHLKMFFSIRNRMSWIPWPRRCTGWWSRYVFRGCS
jgi:hypothetical protein